MTFAKYLIPWYDFLKKLYSYVLLNQTCQIFFLQDTKMFECVRGDALALSTINSKLIDVIRSDINQSKLDK